MPPVQRSYLNVIFMAWRQEVAWGRAEADFAMRWQIRCAGYIKPRCVLTHMLWEVEFKKAIARLWEHIDMLICAPEGRALIQTLHVAVESMPTLFIKICSYKGVCLRRDPGCARQKRYQWYDPTNRVYGQVWYLVVRYCKFIDRKTALNRPDQVHWCNTRSPFATRMLGIHTRACERWPSDSEPRHYERLGDLFELVLGRCYCDGASRLDGLLHIISDIVFWVRDIDHAVWFNQRTQPRNEIPARTWADAIHWIYELQRLKKVQCRDYRYSPEEEEFDQWASAVSWCYRER